MPALLTNNALKIHFPVLECKREVKITSGSRIRVHFHLVLIDKRIDDDPRSAPQFRVWWNVDDDWLTVLFQSVDNFSAKFDDLKKRKSYQQNKMVICKLFVINCHTNQVITCSYMSFIPPENPLQFARMRRGRSSRLKSNMA